MSVHLTQSVWMYNMEAMTRMGIITTVILIAIMIKVFNSFHMLTLINLRKAMLQFIKETKISEKNKQKTYILLDKVGCQKYQVLVNAIGNLMPANFSNSESRIKTYSKIQSQNLSEGNDEVSSHFLFIF